MSINSLSEYITYAKYARFLPAKKRRETWSEQVKRVFGMHETKYGEKLNSLKNDLKQAKKLVDKKIILGSQRALQFGGKPILKHEAKMYNCTASYADRVDFFKEAMYLLLCGCGVGFSVQTHHAAKLPNIQKREQEECEFVIPDSIEGWSDALGVLVSSYFVEKKDFPVFDLEINLPSFSGKKVKFDFSVIRPKGSYINWGGKAPGSSSLEIALKKIEDVFEKAIQDGRCQLKPIEIYDIVMHASDAVLGGGVRRSATICLFSLDDNEMLNAKTGDWFVKNPQRGRSNNSVVLLRDKVTKEQFDFIYEKVKEFGEPGFLWVDDLENLVNPCVEISLYAYDEDGNSGWQFCNLCEINMKKCKTEKQFLDACKSAALIGTLQAGYSNFSYLTETTKKIVQREALLGISMTGMMDSPKISFNPDLQKKGAKTILSVNSFVSKIIGINECARATCIKPAGTTSLILGTASGVHPHHANKYFRRVQANKLEFTTKTFEEHNPLAVEESVWSSNGTDVVLTFLCEIPKNAKTKNQINALQLLEYVKLTQTNWVKYGTRLEKCVKPWLRHNVSNTINVKENEWYDVRDFIYTNKNYFTGVSILSMNGDKDYPQAPFCTVFTPEDIVKEYGEASLMASGLIVDGLHSFDKNLWKACDSALGIGELIEITTEPKEPIKEDFENLPNGLNNYDLQIKNFLSEFEYHKQCLAKLDWIRRAKQFSSRYFNGNLKKMTYCLKDVHNCKLWYDLKREWIEINWADVVEESFLIEADSIGGEACAGGKCEIGELGQIQLEKINKEKINSNHKPSES
jgi:ribonucleoside-diphosphate reductase alpha chain